MIHPDHAAWHSPSTVRALLDEKTPVSKVVVDPISAVEAAGGQALPLVVWFLAARRNPARWSDQVLPRRP